jgi:ribonuclease-3
MAKDRPRSEKLCEFQQKIKYQFKNISLLEEALTHSSFANENGLSSFNERLEFLGDAVLELISSEKLYGKYPSLDEGRLTRLRAQLVCKNSLSLWAKAAGLPKLIRLGRSLKSKVSDAVAADAAEAVFGAVFLDSGYEGAKKVVAEFLTGQEKTASPETVDPKTKLQELLQSDGSGVPYYETVERPAPDGKQLFKVRVTFKNKKLADAWGVNTKAAEFAAAEKALKKLAKEKAAG